MKKALSLFLIVFLCSINVQSEEKSLDSVIDGIQKKYEQIDSFEATFIQESEMKALSRTQLAEGEVWFKKPGKMRWNYNLPHKNQIVSDGKTLWYYDEEEKQVIETPIAQVSETQSSTTLLSGLGNITELFNASFSDMSNVNPNDSYMVDLIPKGEEEYNKATIAVNKDDMMVNKIYLYDPLGNLTTIKLNDIKANGSVSDSLFVFDTPKGAEVVKPPSF